MKLNKIISAVSALTLLASMATSFTVAEASLGGTPTATVEFVKYTTNTSKSWAKAEVNVTIDFSNAEELAAYKEELVYDEEEEDDVLVKTGNGLTTFGLDITNTNANFVPQATNTTKPADAFTLTTKGNGYNSVFGPKNVVTEYYTDSNKLVYKVNFKVTSKCFDEKTTISCAELSLDGKNTTTGDVWSYGQNQGTITVNSVDIPSYNDWSKPSDTPVESITLNKEAIELDLNGTTTETLIATVLPDNATDPTVTWESDKPEIATVDGGKVTAVAEGEAKITATAGGKTATCKVTVKDTTPPEKPIVDVTPSKITGDYGTKTLKYIAKIVKNADATAFIKVTKTLNGKTESKETTQTIAELLGGVATEGTLVSADVAIGVLTADTDAVFSFGLVK